MSPNLIPSYPVNKYGFTAYNILEAKTVPHVQFREISRFKIRCYKGLDQRPDSKVNESGFQMWTFREAFLTCSTRMIRRAIITGTIAQRKLSKIRNNN